MYNIPPMPHNATNPSTAQSDVCYLPSAPMQSVSSPLYPIPPAPPMYPTPAPAPTYPTSVAPPPPPPPYAVSPNMQVPMQQPSPVFFTQMQVPYQGVIITGNMIPVQAVHIRDYMAWSIVNVFLGGFILGFIAVLLSARTRRRKQEGDLQGARTMSNITLTCNLLITIIFFATTAFLIVYFVIILSSLDELYK